MSRFKYKWDGSPYSSKVDPARCAASVHEAGRGVHIYQCLRKPTVGEWCKQHSPEAEQARREKSRAKWEAEQARSPYRTIDLLQADLARLRARVERLQADLRSFAIEGGTTRECLICEHMFGEVEIHEPDCSLYDAALSARGSKEGAR